MNQDNIWKPALIGGVLIGIVSAIPVLKLANCLCCLWVIAGAALAAHLYVRQCASAVTLGRGVVLGLVTGAIGGAVEALFSIPIQLALRGAGAGVAEQVQQLAEQMPNLPAETREMMRSMFEHGVGAVFFVILGVVTIMVYGIAGMVGGALGVALFEKRKPGFEPAAEIPPYQPPPGYGPLPPPPPPPPPADGDGQDRS